MIQGPRYHKHHFHTIYPIKRGRRELFIKTNKILSFYESKYFLRMIQCPRKIGSKGGVMVMVHLSRYAMKMPQDTIFMVALPSM